MIAPHNNQQQETIHHNKQNGFLEMLPEIRKYALFAFRSLRCEAKEEAVAKTIANVFVAFVRLMEQGKREKIYSSVLARYAVAQIQQGRKVGMTMNSNDVLSQAARLKHALRIERLDDGDRNGKWIEYVLEDRRTPVPDQAAFRCDFPDWLNTLSSQRRRIAERLAAGDTTSEVAHQLKLSPGRVSQIRRELEYSWQEFHGELEESLFTTVAAMA